MKANLPTREPEMLKSWEEQDIYKKIIESRSGAETYILHDGPPYANGHIHLGHALNKVLKDIIVKHKTMMGYQAPYVPGWDCHGLPIELNVTREMGDKAKTMPKVEIRKGCRKFADKFVKIQMDEFKRLGVFGDYKNPYKTMAYDYESKIVEVFGEILKAGYIYRSKKPIYWCPTCVTALAEAEVEYGNHSSPSIYVKFKVDPASLNIDGIDKDNTHVVIWTTTPWTLPANLAVCFHPDFEYGVYKFKNEYYILAKGLAMQMEVAGAKIEKSVPISREEIAALKVSHPFIKRESKVIFGDHVTLEQGTGIVHTAPGHGQEDYIIGLKYDLDVFCPVDDEGRFNDDYPDMKGVFVFDANEKVLDIIKKNGTLIQTNSIEHSYPHCWRCKKPLIFRATEQWFFKMDHNQLREKASRSWTIPNGFPRGRGRFWAMVESRPIWPVAPALLACLSVIQVCEVPGKSHDRGISPDISPKSRKPGESIPGTPMTRRTSFRRARSAPAALMSSSGNTTYSTCGSIPAYPILRCSTNGKGIAGPPTSTSKGATSTADGSSRRCGRRSR